jgi:polysaccharide export outer membrane protein
MNHLLLTALCLLTALNAIAESPALAKLGQAAQADPPKPFTLPPAHVTPPPSVAAPATLPRSRYILGPGDEISVFVSALPDEFGDRTFRVDLAGDLSLPIAGSVHAEGLTVTQLQDQLNLLLTKAANHPDAVVSINTFGSQGVSILGAVSVPGVRQLQGPKTLSEVLSLAGGLRADAGYAIKITRDVRWGRIPLPGESLDPTGKFSMASVKVRAIMDASDPALNILMMPSDSITVPVSEKVFAIGSIQRPGGFLLDQHQTISALQVISLSEGLQRTAAPNKAKVLRVVPGSPNRAEISVNLKDIIAGKEPDIQLQSNDILYVPSSKAKSIAYRSTDALVSVATSAAIVGRF